MTTNTSQESFLPSLQGVSQISGKGGKRSTSTKRITPVCKGTATSRSLPVKPTRNPFHKFLTKEKQLAEKFQNIEEQQLERLEKETEEEILKIAESFCHKVQSWDEADNTIADALQLLTPADSAGQQTTEPESANAEEMVASSNQPTKLDFSHLSDPVWVTKLFRVDFGTPWLQGFGRQMQETSTKGSMYAALGVSEAGRFQQKDRIKQTRAEKKLPTKAARPKVAIDKSLDSDVRSKVVNKNVHQVKPKEMPGSPADLMTMSTVWGNQLKSHSTRAYCKHLRELIKDKLEGSAAMDPSVTAVTLSQMKPRVLLEAGLLSSDYAEESLPSSSSSSSCS